MTTSAYFGTDGIRGEYGTFPIIPEFIAKVGWAAAKVLAKQTPELVIGHDGRASHAALAGAFMFGAREAGVEFIDVGLSPSPAIAFLTKHFAAGGGVVISASHNPAKDNGIKLFTAGSGKLGSVEEIAIEAMLQEAPDFSLPGDVRNNVLASPEPEAQNAYRDFCLSCVEGLRCDALRIVLDCANGAMSEVAPAVFEALGAKVDVIAATPSGKNINENSGATKLALLQERVSCTDADMGFAFDGDGDRLMMVDASGDVVDGDSIIYILATLTQNRARFQGGVVGTQMSNMGLEHSLSQLGIPFHRAPVGDAHVLAACKERGWLLGGEPSGHIIHLEHTTTGDGLIAALAVVAALSQHSATLNDALQPFKKYPQTLINVEAKFPKDVSQSPELQACILKELADLEDRGRILVRPSGTEPVLRIMVESDDALRNVEVANRLAEVVS